MQLYSIPRLQPGEFIAVFNTPKQLQTKFATVFINISPAVILCGSLFGVKDSRFSCL